MQGEGSLAPASQHLPAPTSLAGEKLVSECNATEDSVCVRCESGHYQQSWTKERHCTPHDICEECKCSVLTLAPASGAMGAGVCLGSPVRCLTLPLCPDTGLIVKTQGNATHNTVCQCRAGMHCSDTSCQTCVENQPCKQGFGFVSGETQKLPPSPRDRGTASIGLRSSQARGASLAQGSQQSFGGAVLLLCPVALPRERLLGDPHSLLQNFLQPLFLSSQDRASDVIALRALSRRHLLQRLFQNRAVLPLDKV